MQIDRDARPQRWWLLLWTGTKWATIVDGLVLTRKQIAKIGSASKETGVRAAQSEKRLGWEIIEKGAFMPGCGCDGAPD